MRNDKGLGSTSGRGGWPVDVEDDSADLPRVISWSPALRAATQAKHPALTIALHWGTLVAIVVAVAAMFTRDAIEDTTWRQILLHLHRQLGLLVLVGLAARIAVRTPRPRGPRTGHGANPALGGKGRARRSVWSVDRIATDRLGVHQRSWNLTRLPRRVDAARAGLAGFRIRGHAERLPCTAFVGAARRGGSPRLRRP